MMIQTNRDLYKAIIGLRDTRAFGDRSLEEYLRALWGLCRERAAVDSFTGTELFDLLYQAGTAPAPPFAEAWRHRYQEDKQELGGFAGWEATIRRQIIDLREFEESSRLNDEHRYYGMESRRGKPWNNFSPATFLESGAAGYFRGWSPEANGSGVVTVIHVDGKIEKRDAAEFAESEFTEPVFALDHVTWDDFRGFLMLGQIYE